MTEAKKSNMAGMTISLLFGVAVFFMVKTLVEKKELKANACGCK